jgi:NAD(P)H-hydrate epimerase
MRECDRLTIEDLGLPGIALMETAGRGAAQIVLEELDHRGATPSIGIFCGKGNNGGDGFVVARVLLQRGFDVDVYLIARSGEAKGDAAINLQFLETLVSEDLTPGRARIHRLGDEMDSGISIAGLLHTVPHHDLIVDALLGTGLGGPVRTPYRELIAHINASRARVISVDVPSGLDSDNGQPLGAAVHADVTATFGLAKRGQLLFPGRVHCGTLEVVDIGIPNGICDRAGVRGIALTPATVTSVLPTRPAAGHKGTFGHVLALGGGAGNTGALTLCSMGALRAGAGLCTAVGPNSDVGNVSLVYPEVMTLSHVSDLDSFIAAADDHVIAAGPGLGACPTARRFVLALMALPNPRILDADALNIIAAEADAGGILRTAAEAGAVVLTPHPGEFSRLTGRATPAVVADPVASARDFATDTGCIVVLKGAATVVANPDGRYALNTSGNAGMATAGSGDVLTGVIAGLCAQGASAWDAACAGVFVHGLAGDIGTTERGERTLTASDILNHLGAALRRCDDA